MGIDYEKAFRSHFYEEFKEKNTNSCEIKVFIYKQVTAEENWDWVEAETTGTIKLVEDSSIEEFGKFNMLPIPTTVSINLVNTEKEIK